MLRFPSLAPNGSKWLEKPLNGAKWLQIHPKMLNRKKKIPTRCQKGSKKFPKKELKRPKNAKKKHKKKVYQYGSKWLQMVPNEWLKIA